MLRFWSEREAAWMQFPNMKRVTLTFDNGPTPGVTERVLDVLAARRIQATFFAVGKNLMSPAGAELVRKAHSEGHWIGNHTLTHSMPLGEKPEAEYAQREIEETQRLIGELSHPDKLFRPMGDGGRIGRHLLSPAGMQLLQMNKYTCVLWSSVPGDWRDQEGWVDRCVADMSQRDWSVVVLHDVNGGCLPRLPELLDRLDRLAVEYRQDFPEDVIVTKCGELVSPLISQII
jgi:peptidoglycan-N-acetylglucosamine deacetylase